MRKVKRAYIKYVNQGLKELTPEIAIYRALKKKKAAFGKPPSLAKRDKTKERLLLDAG